MPRVLAGSACVSASAVFVKLSEVNAGTAAFLRFALALLVLIPLAVVERRRTGPRPWRAHALDAAAGALLGVDMVFWAAAIGEVGAGVTTVLLNLQVVVYPLLAWAVSGARPPRRFAVTAPLMLAGVALVSGTVGHAMPGTDPVAGAVFGTAAGVAYAGYLLLMRLGGGGRQVVGPVCTSTAAGAVVAGIFGGLWTGLALPASAAAWGWMVALALLGQVLAWVLINPALARLSPNIGAGLLLSQPVLALGLGMAIGERPTPTQLAGCALVIGTVWFICGRGARDRG
ncbi:MAG: EamA family transporter [Streptosporangiales bacterium]|nr:EamA family transporter [Streptosporangiales bacterium]